MNELVELEAKRLENPDDRELLRELARAYRMVGLSRTAGYWLLRYAERCLEEGDEVEAWEGLTEFMELAPPGSLLERYWREVRGKR